MIFHQDKAPLVVTFAPMMVADHMQAQMRGDVQWISPEQIIVGKTGRNIAQIFVDLGVSANANIGVVGLEPYPPFYFDGAMPYNTLTGIKERLPQLNFVPVYKHFFQLASVKSAEELEHVRYAAMIGEAMSESMRATALVGHSEADIAAAVTAKCLSMGGFTAEILMGSGTEYIGWGQPAWQYRSQPPRKIEQGDIVLSEIFALYGMYETQHQAAVAVGKIHPNLEKAAVLSHGNAMK